MNNFPQPLDIDIGIGAVVLQQGNGDAGSGGRLHVGKHTFEHVEATYADHCFDLSGLDQLEHDRGALGDQHGVAEAFGFFF